MKVLYYDCFSGISGDMNLGALLDLGVEKDYLIAELGKLGLKGWNLDIVRDQRHGIKGTKVTVNIPHEHVHRHLYDIEKIIDRSQLDKDTRELSKKIFMKVAVAEAKVHDIPVQEVHFHEVGAMDSIIDIVGAAICLRAINPDLVVVSEVELGGGMVKCDHGRLPVPAPATAEIMKDIPSRTGGVNFEATTPTGAAILAATGNKFGSGVSFKIIKTAYGVGHKDHPNVPNLLRVILGELTEDSDSGHDAMLLECNIDDMNPEFYSHISERLFTAGASDVWLGNIMMKKGRPGIVLSIICENELTDRMKKIIFTESTTLGIRTFPFRKETLIRKFETADTTFGKVRIKRSYYRDQEVSCKPEYDDCLKIAAETGQPLKDINNIILNQIQKIGKINK